MENNNQIQYRVSDAIAAIDEAFPNELQERWDNSGLLIGNANEQLKGALLTLDVTEQVVDEAIDNNCNLIISHHPVMFDGVKQLTGATADQRIVMKAVRHNIAIYAAHTNVDKCLHGTSNIMAERLNLTDRQILEPATNALYKVVVYVPQSHAQTVRNAMFAVGAGQVGNYDSCSFNVNGNGTFKANEGANPFVGSVGKMHTEAETRIETILPYNICNKVIAAAKAVHPYEEMAYDIFKLQNEWQQCGFGIVGNLPKPLSEDEFLTLLKDKFGCRHFRYTQTAHRQIQKVALCSGSGSDLISNAIATGAQAYVTADIKYHQFFEAEGKIMLADIGHYESEQFTKQLFLEVLIKKMPTFAPYLSKVNSNPIKFY